MISQSCVPRPPLFGIALWYSHWFYVLFHSCTSFVTNEPVACFSLLWSGLSLFGLNQDGHTHNSDPAACAWIVQCVSVVKLKKKVKEGRWFFCGHIWPLLNYWMFTELYGIEAKNMSRAQNQNRRTVCFRDLGKLNLPMVVQF